GRQPGPQPLEAIAALDAHTARGAAGGWREAAERGLERTRFRAQELDEHRAVLRPQLTRRDQRRARVQVPLPAAGAKLREQRGVLAQLRRAGLEAREAPDAGGRLGRGARQVVAAAAGVATGVQASLALLLQRPAPLQPRPVLVPAR